MGYEGPYLPGASAGGPVNVTVIFDLRGAIKQNPTIVAGPSCSKCATCPKGMASASLDQFQAGYVIADTPVGYTPGVGPAMNFTVNYRQRLANQPSTFNYSNLGPQWNCSWISYISGGPSDDQSDAVYHGPDGSQHSYSGYEQTVAQGVSATLVKQGDFQTNEGWTHATLHYYGQTSPEEYQRVLPDGTVETYAQRAGSSFFLTLVTDPQGNTVTLNYDPVAAANGQAILTSVTDSSGSQLIFGYSTANPLQITSVTRSRDSLSAKFQYTGGQLTSITDTIGMTSNFSYTTGTNFITSMTTPYGKTTFNSSDTTTSLEADMTNPLGQNERVEYQESLSTSLMPASDPTAPSKTGLSIDNTNLNQANSFYWTRRAMADAAAGSIATDSAGFYALAQMTHWEKTQLGTIPVPLSTKMPLEGRIWYNYPGQSDVDYLDTTAAGASISPSVTARVLDDGTTAASFASYNNLGLITQSIDPIGRTTNYSYDTNGIDLLTVTQTSGGVSGGDLLSTMTYNNQHEPLTVVDAAGQTKWLTYYLDGQLNTSKVLVGSDYQTTTLSYDSNNYPASVLGPMPGAITTYVYDSVGRMQTVTDSEGYRLTYAYDNLDRMTGVTYPDSTTDLTAYRALDVDHTTDRQGRVTSNTYDAIREILTTTDPLSRTTKYTWCTCGGLSTLTDANGNVTTWGLDLQGRVTSKTYADSSAIHYVYETNTSRLHTMTDARGNLATYSYNADNTLSGTAYTPASGVAATPNVSFLYDAIYNRVTSMADGAGTTAYAYYPVTSGSNLGAGRLQTVTSPIVGTGHTAVVNYAYDSLGRVMDRTVDGGSDVVTTFDALGRVTNVVNPLAPSPGFQYDYVDTTSRLQKMTAPSSTGLITNYSYFGNTGDQRLETIQNMQGSTQLSKFDYTYNPVGTIATWSQQADSSAAVVHTLGYDNADQLASDTQSGGATASNGYRYDPAGNRLSETVNGSATAGGQFNNVNQLTAYGGTTNQTVAGHSNNNIALSSATVNAVPATISNSTNFSAVVPLPSGSNVITFVAQPNSSSVTPLTQRYGLTVSGTVPTALTYDANGNCTQDETGNTYTWDALNRLVCIAYHSGTYFGTHTEFIYDGLSRRVQIVEKSGTTYGSGTASSTKSYLWIGSQIAEERDTNNRVTKRFFPQGEQQITGGTTSPYYYTRDHLGSVREMCSSSGSIAARYSYDPYGRTTLVSGSNLATFQYADYYAHQSSGLNLTWYRAYDQSTGRWLSRDPAEESGGLNLYGYSEDEPVGETDPFGLASMCRIDIVVAHFTQGLNSTTQQALNRPPNCQYALGVVGCGSNGANDALNAHGSGVKNMPRNNSTDYGDPHTEQRAKQLGIPKTDIGSTFDIPADLQAALATARAQAKRNCATKCCSGGTTIHVTIIGNGLRKANSDVSKMTKTPEVDDGYDETVSCP